MFIETRETPNPNALKFILHQALDQQGVWFSSREEAQKSPLASCLFSCVEGVVSIFFGEDFVAIAKSEEEHWEHMKPFLLHALCEALLMGVPVFDASISSSGALAKKDLQDENAPSALHARIQDVLETYIKPAILSDGGDVELVSFEGGVVRVRLQGVCVGCPSASITLKRGIEATLKHYVPGVLRVEAEDFI